MPKENIDLNTNINRLSEIANWFEEKDEVDVEKGLKMVKEAAKIIKESKGRLSEIENQFEEIKKEIEIDEK